MKHLLKITFLIIISFQLSAQSRTINGIVTAANDGLPLPGVNILIKGTSAGVQTNFDGVYFIKVEKGDVLQFMYVGMFSQSITIKDQTEINVILEQDTSAIHEVVVMAYRTKTNISPSSSSITIRGASSVSKKSKKRSSNISRALAGQVAGITIQTNNSAPSVATNVKIRGHLSDQSNDPLFVLDGLPVSESDFNSVKTKDIKHVEILNAQQGAAIYGYEGQKGVVCLRTKGLKNNTDFSIIYDFLNYSYEQIQENPFKRSTLSPLSTFSIDVDKAAYSNVRRMINNGQNVPKNAVRIEEMINYFDYNYPQPSGEHPFSINTDVVKTPWNAQTQLVRIGLQGKTYANEALPASNLTFLIDVSGSMNASNKLQLLKSAFKLLVNQLREKDKVAIVVYAGAAGVVLEPTAGNYKESILAALSKLEAGGSTAGGAGIELAYELAQKNFIKNGNNRVILATDGDFNVGASSNNDMQKLIEEKRQSGVYLSVLGFGYGNLKDSKLEILADQGNGNHAYIDTMQEAQKVFGKEFGGTLFTIAKDVKIQVEFNPNKVQAYRLIGYENRLLADEDFIDDSKDAGELGSGHSVTALYELIPVGVKSHFLDQIDNLKYTTNSKLNSFSDELFTVKFRYKKPDSDKSIEMVHVQNAELSPASEDMNFASAVALFGMTLRQSKYANNAKIETVLKLAEAGKFKDENGYRSEFIRLVKSK